MGSRGGANVDKKIHPTQKPSWLYANILNDYAKQGMKILDTHGGSFSSAIAAHDLGFEMTIIDKAKQDLEKLGYTAINPFDNGLEQSCTWEQHMIADSKMLRQCDAICLLSNWNNSIGANIEYLLAKKWNLEIIYQ